MGTLYIQRADRNVRVDSVNVDRPQGNRAEVADGSCLYLFWLVEGRRSAMCRIQGIEKHKGNCSVWQHCTNIPVAHALELQLCLV